MKHICLECEMADMVRETKDVTVTEGRFSEVVQAVYGWHCPNCGNIEFLADGDGKRFSAALDRVFQKCREDEG
jgi:HTH-type transcriptional regulator/antitoxin MqsA